ncbi:hypothetical protein ACFX1R_033922 [Malus domestica]
MRFMLTVLNVIYVLDPKLEPIREPSDKDSDNIVVDRKKREEDELVCRGHILGTLSDRLYDMYAHIQSPKEIWEALEHKYTTEKRVGAIMAKLPQTWNNYRKKLLHMVEDISLENLQKGIQIEEET